MMQKISKAELAARLEARVECAEGGVEGLNILLYGWKKFRKYGAKYIHAFEARDWMYSVAVMDLSEYAGCDLIQNSLQGGLRRGIVAHVAKKHYLCTGFER